MTYRNESPEPGVGRRGASAALWSAASTIGRFGLQLVAQVVLARLLGPDTYGVFGLGMVVLAFCTLFATFGFGWSLAQLPEVDDDDIRYAFTWQMIFGIASGLAMFVFAGELAQFFNEPRAVQVIRWMSLGCVLSALGTVASQLMRRHLNFRASGLIQLGAYAAGYIVVGLPMAWLGFGVHALVAAWLVQLAVSAVGQLISCPHPWKPRWRAPQSKAMWRIGWTVLVTNLGNWLAMSLDRLMVGRALNAHALGIYSAGSNLANMPNSLLIGALQPVFMSAAARVQSSPERLRSVYGQIVSTIWVVMFPCFLVLALVSPDVVALLYGPAWEEVSAVLTILFVAMPAYLQWGMSTPVLWNTGRAHWEFLLQVPQIPLAALAYFAFASHGVAAAAAIAGGTIVLRGFVAGFVAFKLLQLKGRLFGEALTRGLVLSAIVLTPAWCAREWLVTDCAAVLRLVVTLCALLPGAAIVLIGLPGILGGGTNAMIVRFVPKWEHWLQARGVRVVPLAG